MVEKNGNAYLASNSAISYIRTNWYESNVVQILIFGVFTITSFIMTVIGIISLLRRKSSKNNYVLAGLSMAQFALFICMCILIIYGYVNFTILNIAPFIRMFGILITVTSMSGVLYSVYLCTRKNFLIKTTFVTKKILLIVWNLSSIIFCLWMLQVNIL